MLKTRSVTLTQKARGVLQIFRPELPAAAGVCVLLGEVLALGAAPPLPALGLGFACGFFLSGSALITNDYFDLEVDRVNAPQRPLPAGILTPREVMALGIVAAIIGLAAAAAFGPLALGLSLVVWLMGFAYNWKLKAAGLWGNLVVAASVGITFVLGGIAVGQPWSRTVWLFALIALVFDLAEEIAGDAMDAEGDQRRGSHSIAIVRGRQAALRVSGALFGLVVALTLLPLGWGGLGLAYFIPISLTDLLIVFFVARLLRSQTPAAGRRAMRGLYLSGSLGLLAFLVGSFLAA
ncbi:MAG: UbiA family prenyltransferase [Oscillochloris sp.]|nr:UbiA family prenyltransferase [Oscillochloris sp.]